MILFYDMYDSITPAQKEAYKRLFTKGKGMIFMHHALVSYQNWLEFKNMIGGKYHRELAIVDGKEYESTYKHDVWVNVSIEDKDHPVTLGLENFEIFDEVYGNCEILPSVHPLLSTNHPQSMEYIGWVNEYESSEVIYIQLGHGPEAFANKNFQRLVRQAIEWSAERHR